MRSRDWREAKEQFFSRLQKNLEKETPYNDFLNFSVKPADCILAKCLEPLVSFLKMKCDPVWLAVVMYDPTANSDQVHSRHLNFYVNNDLKNIFLEEINRMFLITGLPCGLQQYLPSQNTTGDIPQWPPLVLQFGTISLEQNVRNEFNSWIQLFVKKSTSETTCKTEPCRTGCDSCTGYLCNIVAPEEFENYIQNISESRNKLARTAYCFSNRYPSSTYTGVSDRCLTLFIPGIYIPGKPYYMNGLLVSFSEPISLGTIDLLKEWTQDVCWSLASAVFVKEHVFLGPWKARDAGAELTKYIDNIQFKVTGENSKKIIDIKENVSQDNWYGVAGWTNDTVDSILRIHTPKLQRTQIVSEDVLSKLKKSYTVWCSTFKSLGVSEENYKEVAAISFVRQNLPLATTEDGACLYLIAMLAHAKEAGVSVMMDNTIKWDNILSVNWTLNRFCAPYILKWLLLVDRSNRKQRQFVTTNNQVNKSSKKQTVIWMLDMLIEDKDAELPLRIYLDNFEKLDNDRLELHQLTQTIWAAEALGNPTHILPAWSPAEFGSEMVNDIMNKPFDEECQSISNIFEAFNGKGVNRTYVLLRERQARIFVIHYFHPNKGGSKRY